MSRSNGYSCLAAYLIITANTYAGIMCKESRTCNNGMFVHWWEPTGTLWNSSVLHLRMH